MPDTTQPNLGYGGTTEATRDQVNIWMRGQPWYQQMLKSWGQSPDNVHLQDWQKEAIVRGAQANGVVVDQGKQEIDDSGNFRNVGHKLRNTLIVAGLAGATIATMGAAGAFSGAAGAAMAGGEAAAGTTAGATAGGLTAGGLLASTTTVPLMGGTIAGSIASGAVPAALAGTTGATTAGLTGGLLASHATAPTAAGTIAGAVPSGAVPAATGTTGGILGTLGRVAMNKGGDMLANAAAGSSNERAYENSANLNAANVNNRAMLDSAVFNRDLPTVQASQVAHGDLMSTMHDAAPTGDPRIDKFGGGGLRPSAFGADTHAAGDALKRQALQNLLTNGGRVNPQITTPQPASAAEKAMGYGSTALNILNTYRNMGGSF